MLNCVYFFFLIWPLFDSRSKGRYFQFDPILTQKTNLVFSTNSKKLRESDFVRFFWAWPFYFWNTVRPRDTQPQAARFWIGSKNTWESRFLIFFSLDTCFCTFFDKWVLEMHIFDKMSTWDARFCTFLHIFCTFFTTWILEIHETPIK